MKVNFFLKTCTKRGKQTKRKKRKEGPEKINQPALLLCILFSIPARNKVKEEK